MQCSSKVNIVWKHPSKSGARITGWSLIPRVFERSHWLRRMVSSGLKMHISLKLPFLCRGPQDLRHGVYVMQSISPLLPLPWWLVRSRCIGSIPCRPGPDPRLGPGAPLVLSAPCRVCGTEETVSLVKPAHNTSAHRCPGLGLQLNWYPPPLPALCSVSLISLKHQRAGHAPQMVQIDNVVSCCNRT